MSIHWEPGVFMHHTPEQVVDELTYRSYAHNRNLHPDIEPEKWAVIFSNAAELEKRYIASLGAKGAA